MRILITGGNGYVGRVLTRLLYPAHEVTVLDCLRQGHMRFTESELQNFAFIKADIRDFDALSAAMKQAAPEVVIHLAAIHYIPECDAMPDEAISVNTLGTMNIVRTCPEGARLVFASTAAVYGAENQPHEEAKSVVAPMDVYGLTKAHAEQYITLMAPARGVDARIVRLFNVIGPGETNPHLLPAILAQALRGERVLWLGNCHPKRDYIHVSDVANGFAAVALTDTAAGHAAGIVNLGSGAAYSVYEVVDELANVIGEPLKIETDVRRVRAVDRPFMAANNTRIRQSYGWAPQFGIRESLRDLWANPDIPAELLEKT